MNEYKLLLLPGDGIGPEVLDATMRVVGWYGRKGLPYQTEEALLGGAAIDATGRPDPDETFVKAIAADAVLMGSVGGPKWDGLPFAQRAERGLLRVRKDMGVYANLRPALCFDALKDASTLKPEIVAGLDILIVRELMGGVYFGEPKETTTLPDGQKRARGHHAGDQPNAVGLFSRDVAPGQHDFGRPGMADRSGQQEADPELGRGEPVIDAGCSEVRSIGGDTNIGRKSQAEPSPDGRAIDGREYRLVETPNSGDDVVEQFHGPHGQGRQREALGVGD